MADQPLPLRLFALGPPEASLGDNVVAFPTRKTLALLFYLAIEAAQQPRERLAGLLWPESSPEHSYASLRNTLSRLQIALRQAGGQPRTAYLSVTKTSLGLNPEANIDLDLHKVARAYDLANTDPSSQSLSEGSDSLLALQMAAACQRGDFLAGFSLGDAPGFDDWAAVQREDWHRRLGLILDRLSEIQFSRGEFSDATATASRWIALDPLSEVAYRRKMRIHFAAGERGKALETYDACRAMLAAELGIEPEPDTDALAERIRTQLSHTQPRPRSITDLPRRSATSVDFLGSLFTGRETETQALVEGYHRAAAGQPQLMLLRGEAGIGKTRLASKFLAWVNAQGAELLQGGAFESGSHFPFQPLVDAIRARLGSEKSLRSLLDDVWLSPLSQLFPEIRQRYPDLFQPPRETQAIDSETTQSQIFESLVQLTLALAKRAPLVILVDDLQWADSATLDWLQYAIRRWRDSAALSSSAALGASAALGSTVRILLLISLRSEALHPVNQPPPGGKPPGLIQWLARLEHELAPVHLDLALLGEIATVQMVLSILETPSEEFARWLYAETRGHPYYLIETLKDLLERRVLRPKRRAEGQWTFSVNPETDFNQAARVPSTVHTVIRSRLNRLSPNAFNILSAGAVLDQQLTFEHLAAISSVSEDNTLSALDELISGRLLLEIGEPGAASGYYFVNDMLRDVVYTEAGDARRRLFHHRALEILEAEGKPAAVLAHHALAAGLAQHAFRHSLAAGREALRLSAVSEAAGHFERALQLVREEALPEMPDEASLRMLYMQLGRVYELVSQAENASAIDAE